MEEKMYFWDKHKTIISYYELLSGAVCDRYELTQMEYDILMFLHNNPQNNTAAEIVKIRKSTIEIFLLDKAELIVEAGLNAQKEFAKNVLSGMTEEEKHMCMKVFDKICNNAEKCLREHKERDL